jgi:hypothetical protein
MGIGAKRSQHTSQTKSRFKGLGEMNAEELADTTMDVSVRTLMKVEIEDAAMAEDIFSMLMGEKVQPRKEFIERTPARSWPKRSTCRGSEKYEGRSKKGAGSDPCPFVYLWGILEALLG